MNVSMQDSFNLGWKIALVVKGLCHRSILKTYESERRQVAQDLIAFDHKFSRLFSGRPAKDVMDEEGVSMDEFKAVFQKGGLFAAGVSVDYGPSMLIAKPRSSAELDNGSNIADKGNAGAYVVGKQNLIKSDNLFSIRLGMRFPSYKVVNQADVRVWHFQHWLKSDGRFRIILFAGNMASSDQRQRVQVFCDYLSSDTSVLRRVTPPSIPLNSPGCPIEILTLHSAPRKEVELLDDFPEILHPLDEFTGYDYEKVFTDDLSYHEPHGHAYEGYGVDKMRGCVVVCRPDQYVGWIGELEDTRDLDAYFEAILIVSS